MTRPLRSQINRVRFRSGVTHSASGRFYPLLYASSFILVIPAFAAIYNLLIPYEFIHQSIKNERHFIDERRILAKDLSLLIEKSVNSKLLASDFCLDSENGVSDIKVVSIGRNDESFNIDVQIGVSKPISKHSCALDTYKVPCSFYLYVPNIGLISDQSTPPPSTVMDAVRGGGSNAGIKLRCAHVDHEWISSRQVIPERLSTPDNIRYRLAKFWYAEAGFPAESSGQFSRMLYFSAAVSTAIGAPDIIPIGIIARYVVTAQSILSTLLIGLFLNAISRQPSRGGPLRQNSCRLDKKLNLGATRTKDGTVRRSI